MISFFPLSLFPTRKDLMLLIYVAHPSEKACLCLTRGPSGDTIAPGVGTTPVLSSPHQLLSPSHQALQLLQTNTYLHTMPMSFPDQPELGVGHQFP